MNNDNTDYVSNESGTLSRLFKLPQHGTTVRTELIAGMTTFLTMVYIVFVNPQILGAAQMDPKVFPPGSYCQSPYHGPYRHIG